MNSTPFDLQIARVSDAAEIAALINSAYRGDYSKQGWTTEAELLDGQRTNADLLAVDLAVPNRRMLLLREASSKKLVGCVALFKHGEQSHLGMLTIEPSLQSAGLGKRLLLAAEEDARASGARVMTLNTINGRDSLIAWYLRHGYKLTPKTEPFPYGDERFGIPKVEGLHFLFFEKSLERASQLAPESPAH